MMIVMMNRASAYIVTANKFLVTTWPMLNVSQHIHNCYLVVEVAIQFDVSGRKLLRLY